MLEVSRLRSATHCACDACHPESPSKVFGCAPGSGVGYPAIIADDDGYPPVGVHLQVAAARLECSLYGWRQYSLAFVHRGNEDEDRTPSRVLYGDKFRLGPGPDRVLEANRMQCAKQLGGE